LVGVARSEGLEPPTL